MVHFCLQILSSTTPVCAGAGRHTSRMPRHREEGAGRAELAVGQKSVGAGMRLNAFLVLVDQFYGGLTNFARWTGQ
jgi:hypothetical protein